MKIAVPVQDDSLAFAPNAGHSPYFAVFAFEGSGMFRRFTLDQIRPNPRTDLDHDHDGEHACHGHHDEEHVRQHAVMAEALEDCDYLVVKSACKNTVLAMNNLGIRIEKYAGGQNKADALLAEMAPKFG